MPNHIKNKLKLVGSTEQIQSVFEKYNIHVPAQLNTAHDGTIICKTAGEDYSIGWFDPKNGEFTQRGKENIIGLPEEYSFEINQSKDCFPSFEKIILPPDCDEYKDLPNQESVRNHPNWWRTWNINNWGTKWGGYSYEAEKFGTYTFETAWSGVPDLMAELSKQNPDVEFEYTYADEDTGCNVGKFTFKGGKVLNTYLPSNCSKEAYDLAFELRPERKEDYRLIDGEYEYIDEDETED